jgi:hypothetical protein
MFNRTLRRMGTQERMTEHRMAERRIGHIGERLNIGFERRKLNIEKILHDILNKFIARKYLLIEGQQGLHISWVDRTSNDPTWGRLNFEKVTPT